jgi:5-(carboxyamino)imidazole ribonucleotide mutase
VRITAHLVNILIGSNTNGLGSLLSTFQMPGGIPAGTLAVGKAGAFNAALLALAITAN